MPFEAPVNLKILLVECEYTTIAMQFGHAHQAGVCQLHLLVVVFRQQVGDGTGMVLQARIWADTGTQTGERTLKSAPGIWAGCYFKSNL